MSFFVFSVAFASQVSVAGGADASRAWKSHHQVRWGTIGTAEQQRCLGFLSMLRSLPNRSETSSFILKSLDIGVKHVKFLFC